MSETSIEWTDVTWNPIRGCSPVSPGCKNCYAQRVAARFSGKGQPYEGLATNHVKTRIQKRQFANGEVELRKVETSHPRWTGEVRFVPEMLDAPLRWKKPRRVFVNSMSDLFHESLSNEQIVAVFGVMAACPQHTFQVLTKRPERMREFFEWASRGKSPLGIIGAWAARAHMLNAGISAIPRALERLADSFSNDRQPLPNVWLGVSVEDQATADKRIVYLLETPAAVRFVSAEPLLGPIDLTRLDFMPPMRDPSPYDPVVRLNALTGHIAGPDDMLDERINWVITGGESGPKARPCEIEWIRSIVRQCRDAKVPVFVKQLGAKPALEVEPTGNFRTHDGERQFEMGVRLLPLRNRKGGDPSEWPEDLRIREWPEVRT